jgi:transposase InsO family protein
VVLGQGRRQLLWFAVTRNPTAEWLAQHIVEAFPWDTAPGYLLRDNDAAYGRVLTRRLRAMGIRDRPITPSSPWQNAYVERLIGTIRRDSVNREPALLLELLDSSFRSGAVASIDTANIISSQTHSFLRTGRPVEPTFNTGSLWSASSILIHVTLPTMPSAVVPLAC